MGILDIITHFIHKNSYTIRECIFVHQDGYYEKLDQIKEKFIRIFYEQTIACIVADTFDLFLELHKINNPFYKNIEKITKESGQAFYKSMGMYYTLSFIQDTDYQIDTKRMEEVLFYVFSFSQKDLQVYYDFKALREMEESVYEIEFGKYLLNEVIGESINDFQLLAQVYHYAYNSYKSFKDSLEGYTMIESKPV